MDGGEVPADDILLRDVDDVREANSTQCFGDDAYAGTVDRGVDDLQVVVACDRLLLGSRE